MAKFTNLEADIIDAMMFQVGDLIVAGEEEEREDGQILDIDGEQALIAWRQGTRTWIALAHCEPFAG